MNRKTYILIGVFWFLILAGTVGLKEFTILTGKEVHLKIRPVDPRDLFRGDYVILSYDISNLEPVLSYKHGGKFEPYDDIYVVLTMKEPKIASYSYATDKPPKNNLFIKGKVISATEHMVTVEYGIESYFVPEGEGRWIERELSQMHAKVMIDQFGNAVLKGLIKNGKLIRF